MSSIDDLSTILLQLQSQNAAIQTEMMEARDERSTLGNMVQSVIDRFQELVDATPAPATPTAAALPLPTAPAAAIAPVVQLPSAREAKGADPEAFSGDRKATDSFLRAVKLNIALQPRMYSTEEGKILYTLSWMRGGTAGAWAENLATVMLDPAITNPYPTFAKFLTAFENAFGEPDRAFSARTQLHSLKQGSMSAEEYTAHFDALAGRTGFDGEALVDAYQRGLNGRLLEKIHYTDLPIGLTAWKEKAKKLDNLYRRLQQTAPSPSRPTTSAPRSALTPQRPPPPRPVPAAFTPPAPAPVSVPSWGPMDVDATRRRDMRKCYVCQQEGHLARNCPQNRGKVIRTIAEVVRDEICALLKPEESQTPEAPTESSQDF